MTIIYENPLKQINLKGVYHKLKYHDFNYDKEIIDTQFKDFFEISQIIHNLHIDEHHKSNVILENSYLGFFKNYDITNIEKQFAQKDFWDSVILVTVTASGSEIESFHKKSIIPNKILLRPDQDPMVFINNKIQEIIERDKNV